ncbi:hypothetical protein NC651_010614 [Populus alba x Populus x berolinensis]|nr:hypothetical protein NC651_010614 [Populus alba x Populus x berolinensis]
MSSGSKLPSKSRQALCKYNKIRLLRGRCLIGNLLLMTFWKNLSRFLIELTLMKNKRTAESC